MEDTVSYHFATVKQRRENRDEIEFHLSLRQQPKQSRMCGVGEKADRLPIDPPPIVQLKVIDPSLSPLETNAYLQNPYYFMYASLMAADLDEEVHLLRDGKTRSTTGSVVSSLYHLKDTDNTDAGFFVFPDLSVRMEGKYRLKLSLFEIIGKEVFHCKSILSDQFIVYSAKKFPGMEESTSLSRSFADQGLKIRIRKELRQRKKIAKRNESDDESPYMSTRTIDKRPRQEPSQVSDSIVPNSNTVISPTSSILDPRRLSSSSQTIYSMPSSYSDRSQSYFVSNDMDVNWTGSRSQDQDQDQQQQRNWQIPTTPMNNIDQQSYYIDHPASNQSKRYSFESYNDHTQPLPQSSFRQYTSPLPPLPSTSYSSHASASYSHTLSTVSRGIPPQPHPSYSVQQHHSSNRPLLNPYHHTHHHPHHHHPHHHHPHHHHPHQQQYTNESIHQLRMKQDQSDHFNKKSI
ncbi:unnamed protein product [Cunninghamella blakesleeana]